MPRNRDYWNTLEAHIRSNPHDLLGMNSTHGANALRRLSKLVARHAKIHKSRSRTVEYTITKLEELKESGFVESLGPGACQGICELTAPVWEILDWDPLRPEAPARQETTMAKHTFNYPDRLHACDFCGGKEITMNAGLYKLEDLSMTALFSMQCTSCGYESQKHESPDSCVHAWNMSKKVEIMRLIDGVSEEYKRQQ
jgi:hypothetical protein